MNQHNKHEKSKSNCEIHVHSYRMKKKKQLIQEDVLECPLCQTLFYQPITTSCGHTFCKNCILRFNLTQKNSSIFFFSKRLLSYRSMDHTNRCPMCRTVIYITPESAINNVLQSIILLNFSKENQMKEREIEQDLVDQKFNLPLFMLGETILMPESSLPLHVFEPRYRLMIRRCLEGARRFGIVPLINGKLASIGTTAVVENHWTLPDGRTLICTIGDVRFKVLNVWDQDGYQVAKVDYVWDDPLPAQLDLMKKVEEEIEQKFKMALDLFHQKFSPAIVQQIQEKLRKIPTNAFSFTWWLSYVLPIPVEKKYELLSTFSVQGRLDKLITNLKELDFSEVNIGVKENSS